MARRSLFGMAPVLVLSLGLALTYFLWLDARNNAVKGLEYEFQGQVRKLEDAIQYHLNGNIQVLRGVAGLYNATGQVTRKAFHAYVDSLSLEKRYPGILGIGFSMLLQPGDLGAHVAAMRSGGFPDYRVHPDYVRDLYSAIVYQEPLDQGDQTSIGYDMFAEPTRHEAMARARDLGDAAQSGKVQTTQGAGGRPEFFIYLPIYRPGAPVAAIEERRAALLGWVYARVGAADMIRGMLAATSLGNLNSEFDIGIFDGDTLAPDARMFDSRSGPAAEKTDKAFRAVRQIDIAGRRWSLLVTSNTAFEARLDEENAYLVALAGSSITVMLALLLAVRASSNKRIATALMDSSRVKRELAAREEAIQALFEAPLLGVLYAGADGTLTDANPAALEMLGVSREELLNRTFLTPDRPFIREDGTPLTEIEDPSVTALHTGEPVRGEVVGVLDPKLEDYRWLLVNAVPRFHPGEPLPYQVVVTLSEITRLKRKAIDLDENQRRLEDQLGERTRQLEAAKQELREQAKLVDELYNQAPCAYHALDKEGIYTRVNDTELLWLGYGREELVGWKSFQGLLAEHSREVFRKLMPKLMEIGLLHDVELDMARKDGSVIPVTLNATALRDAAGNFTASRMTLFDNTERRERQRRIDALNATLALRAEEAEAANQAKSIFLANMSQEFRTPLIAIISLNHLLRRAVKEPHQLARLRKVHDLAQRLLASLQNMLELSNVEFGSLRIATVGFRPDHLLQTAAASMRARAKAKGLQLVVEADPALPELLYGDQVRLSQVLVNFVDNATKFTEHGAITLRARKLQETADAVMVRFEVQDSGIGIASEDQGKLFKAFGQVNLPATRGRGGVGLGLAINKRLVHLMGGDIGVESLAGYGSIFWFVVRLAKQGETANQPDNMDDSPATGQGDSVEPPEVSRETERVAEVLAQLRVLLALDDMSSRTLFQKSKPLLRKALGKYFLQLETELEGFEFEQALDTLKLVIAEHPEFARD